MTRSLCSLLAPLFLPALIFTHAFNAQQLKAQQSRKLVVISIDGFDSRFLNDPSLHVKIPNMRALARRGSSGNVMGIGTPALDLMAADHNGRRVASVFMRSTPGLNPSFNFPEADNNQFEAVAEKSSPPGVIDKVEGMFPRFQKELWDDSSSTAAAAWVLATGAPDLLLVHFTDVATEQKATGAVSVYARDALENDDDLIGQILAKVPKDCVVAIVSNHGVENANYLVRPAVLLKKPVKVSNGLIGTTDPAVAESLRKLMADKKRHGIAREVPMSEVHKWAPQIRGWIAAFDTLPNYVASAQDRGPALGPGSHLAVWDLWPTRPGFRSVFIAAGEGVPAKKLGEVEMPTVVQMLAEYAGVRLRKD